MFGGLWGVQGLGSRAQGEPRSLWRFRAEDGSALLMGVWEGVDVFGAWGFVWLRV